MFWILVSLVVIYLLVDWLIRLPKVDNYSQKHIFVTGCDSGFGRALVIRLDRMGFPVFAGCFTSSGAESLRQECSSRLKTVQLDISIDNSIKAALDTVRSALPSDKGLWAVVNNAGTIGTEGFAEMFDRQMFLNTCSVNLFGSIEVSRVFLPLLRKSQGRLINMTSVMGRCPAANAPYCVSKFGLEAYSDVIRREVYPSGVKVCIIEPGVFRTPLIESRKLMSMSRRCWDAADPEVKAAYDFSELEKRNAVMDRSYGTSNPPVFKVVDAYVAAITSKYPRTRYVIGADAKFLFIPLSYLPSWVLDVLLIKSIEFE